MRKIVIVNAIYNIIKKKTQSAISKFMYYLKLLIVNLRICSKQICKKTLILILIIIILAIVI